MKKVCILTSTRADFGLLKPLILELQKQKNCSLHIIASGSHLSSELGYTFEEIAASGIKVDKKLNIEVDDDMNTMMAKSFARASSGFTDFLQDSKPDLAVLLGDRFEMMAFGCSCLLQRIPMVHIHGGELSKGNIDEAIRHSLPKMSHLHFASTEKHKRRIIQMGENPGTVRNVGALGVESAKKTKLYKRAEMEAILGLKFKKNVLLVTLHPETLSKGSSKRHVDILLNALKDQKETTLIFTKANADAEGTIINKEIEKYCTKNHDAFLFDSLGSRLYFSVLSLSDAVVGNSSSGIIEAPTFKVPTINIGIRQGGRESAKSVLNVSFKASEIKKALALTKSKQFKRKAEVYKNPYERKSTAKTMASLILKTDFQRLLKKKFYDLDL